ncbi:hypothetical protein I6E81_00970 [Salinibacterium sp. NG22]|uniref:hypothetical protein n=1 Tax=Salinibacterium sp. NG22 TaxID=2792040 RepID=UPI0018CF50C4|nr:hypothetical protein [Salinibacterium sp. NG22]MBH0108736.1 hypothetical protein [Salinibacterium sp. NG22]
MKSSQLRSKGLIAAVGLALLSPLLIAAPANAAASCWNAGSLNNVATASCSGVGSARVNVTCNAVWPFPSWTDTGAWVRINGGANIVNTHASCAASLYVRAETR